MIFMHIVLAALITNAPATPTGNEAKNKKLMRKDIADSGEAVTVQVQARGATIAQHQRLDSKPHAEAKEAIGHSTVHKQKLKGQSQPDGDEDEDEDDDDEEGEEEEGEDDEDEEDDGATLEEKLKNKQEKLEKAQEKLEELKNKTEKLKGKEGKEEKLQETEAKLAEQEDKVERLKEKVEKLQKKIDEQETDQGADDETNGLDKESHQVARCSAVADCIGYNKGCGATGDTDWKVECLDDECVLESQLEDEKKKRCDPHTGLGSNGRSGQIFCKQSQLYIQCHNGQGLNLTNGMDNAINAHLAKQRENGNGNQDNVRPPVPGEKEKDINTNEPPITFDDLNHAVDKAYDWADMVRDEDFQDYEDDDEKTQVCKTIKNSTILTEIEGNWFIVSYRSGKENDKDSGKGKRCGSSMLIRANGQDNKDDQYKNFKRGRLALCAAYAARGNEKGCCGSVFWMTEDYECHCAPDNNCGTDDQVVDQGNSCLYSLSKYGAAVAGAPMTMEDMQKEANFLGHVNEKITKKFVENGGDNSTKKNPDSDYDDTEGETSLIEKSKKSK